MNCDETEFTNSPFIVDFRAFFCLISIIFAKIHILYSEVNNIKTKANAQFNETCVILTPVKVTKR